MIVVGLVALMAALLLPVIGRMRAASGSLVCASNLRQIGVVWSAYLADQHGRFIEYVWQSPPAPHVAWNNYWPGIASRGGIDAAHMLCPAAAEPAATPANRGYGSATSAWSGRATSNGTCIRLDAARFRDGSYGYNRYLTVGGGFGGGESIAALRSPAEVPVFFDAAYVDARPVNGSPAAPVSPPPDLGGASLNGASPDHHLFLLARHGRGVNVCTADGAVRWVALEEMYTLTWKSNWSKYRLNLPSR